MIADEAWTELIVAKGNYPADRIRRQAYGGPLPRTYPLPNTYVKKDAFVTAPTCCKLSFKEFEPGVYENIRLNFELILYKTLISNFSNNMNMIDRLSFQRAMLETTALVVLQALQVNLEKTEPQEPEESPDLQDFLE